MTINNSHISKKAKIHPSVKIGPFCYIGDNVKIDQNCELKSHVSILGNTNIGKENIFYPFSSIKYFSYVVYFYIFYLIFIYNLTAKFTYSILIYI